ncbi:ABC transporter permease [Paenibacillus xanthanilyticus]|uniref:ABC transporter permease n=1 Tax=Paenibacillus xanthanilyticus TaxID=1783531 RepID=A0ABV8KAQ8_9BACL
MFDFLQLVANENLKIYRRARTWIMFGILVILVLAISLIARYMPGGGDGSGWSMMMTETYLLFILVTIFTVVVSAETVAGEFTSGTIKLLLIRPWSRSKILLSKYISVMLFAFALAATLFVLSFGVNALLFGVGGARGDILAGLGTSRDIAPFSYMLAYYGFEFISLIMIVTVSFMISTVFRSGGLAIGLSLFFLMGGSVVTMLLMQLDYAWVDYLLLIHLDLTNYLIEPGFELRDGVTLGFSLGVLAVYYVLIIAVTWLVFNKRDVAT